VPESFPLVLPVKIGFASDARMNKNATAFVKPDEENNVCAFMIILMKTN